jgi:hypothetical protein
MKLLAPVQPFIVNQFFGSNGEYYRLNGINIDGHNGIDLRTFHGQTVYASHDGDAVYETDMKGGHGVVIKAKGYKTIYWHFVDPAKEPQYKSPIDNYKINPVKAGDLIGYADNTGLSTGDHLHWGLKLISDEGVTLNQGNGYLGAIDPLPFLDKGYVFTKNLAYGQINEDVARLQEKLASLGLFKHSVTGFYGSITKQAVYDFQLQFVNLSWYEKYILRGSKVGEKTNKALNAL